MKVNRCVCVYVYMPCTLSLSLIWHTHTHTLYIRVHPMHPRYLCLNLWDTFKSSISLWRKHSQLSVWRTNRTCVLLRVRPKFVSKILKRSSQRYYLWFMYTCVVCVHLRHVLFDTHTTSFVRAMQPRYLNLLSRESNSRMLKRCPLDFLRLCIAFIHCIRMHVCACVYVCVTVYSLFELRSKVCNIKSLSLSLSLSLCLIWLTDWYTHTTVTGVSRMGTTSKEWSIRDTHTETVAHQGTKTQRAHENPHTHCWQA